MALTTYGGLKASVASWLKRDDLTDQIPDFVSLAEARIARELRLRSMISFGTLTTSSSVDYVALPTDFLELENITLAGDIERNLTYETPEQMDVRFPLGAGAGKPAVYTIMGDRIFFGPAPDSAYTVKFTYYARPTALSADSDTNWILTNHPSLYLFAALAEASIFMFEDDRAPLWEAKYAAEKDALETADDTSLRSGSVLRVRSA